MGTIDLTTDFPFNPSVWIGVGKEFSDSLRLEVLDVKRKPSKFPKPFSTTSHFLPLVFTTSLTGSSISSPVNPTSTSPPNGSATITRAQTQTSSSRDQSRPQRSSKISTESSARYGWTAVVQSLVLVLTTERFPLWALSVWNEMKWPTERQGKWRKSVHWLDSVTHPVEMVVQANDVGVQPTLVIRPAYRQNLSPAQSQYRSLDFSTLVELRHLHQTRYAAEGVRTRDAAVSKLIRELNALLRQEGNRTVGTGQDRKLRWHAPDQEGSIPTLTECLSAPAAAGNLANAAVVAQSRTKKVSFWLANMLPLSTNRGLGTRLPTRQVSSCRISALRPYRNRPSSFPLPRCHWPIRMGFS